MKNKSLLFVCFIAIGLSSAVYSMDTTRLDLWKTPPAQLRVERGEIAALRTSIGTQALTYIVPAYTQHWAYVGMLQELGVDRQGQARAYRDTTMPQKIRDDARKVPVERIRAELDKRLAKRSFAVSDVMHAWACIALLRDKHENEVVINGYRDRLVAQVARASLPSAYEKMLQQRTRATAARLARQRPIFVPPVVVPSPAFRPAPTQAVSGAPTTSPVCRSGQITQAQGPVTGEITQLRAHLQDLNQELERVIRTNRAATEELERLRVENTELRQANPEQTDTASVRAENEQLRQSITIAERNVNLEKRGRIQVMQRLNQHAHDVAQLQGEHADQIVRLQRRIEELERQSEQASVAEVATDDETTQEEDVVKTDQVNYQELQERLEQAEQLVVIQNAVLQGFLHQGKITPQELEEMMQQIAHAIEQADDESGASTSQQVSVVSKKKK